MPDIFDGSQDAGEVDPQDDGNARHSRATSTPHAATHETAHQNKPSNLKSPNEPVESLTNEDRSAQTAQPDQARASSASDSSVSSSPAHKHHQNPDEYSEVMRHERPAKNPLDAFAAKPNDVHFDAQATDEQILLLLRKHPITQVAWIIAALVMAILPFFFSFLPLFDQLPANYEFAAFIGWYLLLMGFILESFLTWFFNVYIVTDERIIDVDFLSLIYKNVSAAKIDNIEDVTANTAGALQSIFNYGTVLVQTAAEKTQFEFELVPQPGKVTRLINELVLEEEREKLEGRVS